MRLRSFNTLLYSIGLLFISQGARSAQNRTVEETSREIIYSAGIWVNGTYGSTTTRFTVTQGSSATLSFTGASAIYFVGYGLIAENLNSGTIANVEFDGVVNRVDLHRDHGGSVVMWSSGPIDPTKIHTIVCKKTSQDNWHYDLHIDAFILTIPDPSEISTSTTTPTSTGSGVVTSTSLTETSPISSSLTTSFTTTTTSGTALAVPVPSMVWNPTEDSSVTDSGTLDVPTGPSSAASSTGTLTGAIVGGVIGAVVLVCLASAFFFLLGRKHRREASFMSPYATEKRAGFGGVGSTSGIASTDRITNNTELHDLTPTTLSPTRAEMGWEERDTALGATTNSTSSEMNAQGTLPTSIPDEEDTSSSWLAAPPAYNQVISSSPSTPLPRTKG
ncbi:hypothetical protein M408DRAFT_331567 [Serendipita vermifera MAFF 305830]|uniref:Uncharacterized protein n=1 Tax=Serendipita vermifera MAFF 305830 TaxID=933852 RepID=A0A0C3AY39_SERVB|nr:hypothetical protein M408DRAFT_331567 [Serendipita vermifera MAFF 305830]